MPVAEQRARANCSATAKAKRGRDCTSIHPARANSTVSLLQSDFLRPFSIGFGAGAIIAMIRVAAELMHLVN